MPVDIEDGDAATISITGGTSFYVLSVAVGKELEMSVYANDPVDLGELRVALEEALSAKQAVILLRADSSTGPVRSWQALDPGAFAKRLPTP